MVADKNYIPAEAKAPPREGDIAALDITTLGTALIEGSASMGMAQQQRIRMHQSDVKQSMSVIGLGPLQHHQH